MTWKQVCWRILKRLWWTNSQEGQHHQILRKCRLPSVGFMGFFPAVHHLSWTVFTIAFSAYDTPLRLVTIHGFCTLRLQCIYLQGRQPHIWLSASRYHSLHPLSIPTLCLRNFNMRCLTLDKAKTQYRSHSKKPLQVQYLPLRFGYAGEISDLLCLPTLFMFYHVDHSFLFLAYSTQIRCYRRHSDPPQLKALGIPWQDASRYTSTSAL